jgi:hypothetical protein
MRKVKTGRPPQLDYEPGALCQLRVDISPALKREIVEQAERNEHRISDEVVLALGSWVGREEGIELR